MGKKTIPNLSSDAYRSWPFWIHSRENNLFDWQIMKWYEYKLCWYETMTSLGWKLTRWNAGGTHILHVLSQNWLQMTCQCTWELINTGLSATCHLLSQKVFLRTWALLRQLWQLLNALTEKIESRCTLGEWRLPN
jgi:hypothetical protein